VMDFKDIGGLGMRASESVVIEMQLYCVRTRVNRSVCSRSCLARSRADCSRLRRNSRSLSDCCCRRCDSARLPV
jgi:hypothetical protein